MSTQLVRGTFIPLSLSREPAALPHTCIYVKGQAFVSFSFYMAMRPLLGTSSLEQLPRAPASPTCLFGENTWAWKIVLTGSFDKMESAGANCNLNSSKIPFTSSNIFRMFRLAQLKGTGSHLLQKVNGIFIFVCKVPWNQQSQGWQWGLGEDTVRKNSRGSEGSQPWTKLTLTLMWWLCGW